MDWNDDWIKDLEKNNYNCYERFGECKNTVTDVKTIAKLMYYYNRFTEVTVEDCVDRTIEWICGSNNQFYLCDKVYKEYDKIVERIKKAYSF